MSELWMWTTDLPCAFLDNSFCGDPCEIRRAKKPGFNPLFGLTILRSPPSIIPFVVTKDALEISSAVSPEAGIITSLPWL